MGTKILGGCVQIARVELLISFETPPVRRIYRPCGKAGSLDVIPVPSESRRGCGPNSPNARACSATTFTPAS